MTDTLKVTLNKREGLSVIYTEGYINNQGGEEIAKIAYRLIEDGERKILLNLAGTKIAFYRFGQGSSATSCVLPVAGFLFRCRKRKTATELKPEQWCDSDGRWWDIARHTETVAD